MMAAAPLTLVICPPCLATVGFITLGYGIADYLFEINDTIDENTNEISIFGN